MCICGIDLCTGIKKSWSLAYKDMDRVDVTDNGVLTFLRSWDTTLICCPRVNK